MSRSLLPAAGRRTRISVPSTIQGVPLAPRWVDDVGEGPQPHYATDGAPALGEQRPHLTDGSGDGGAVPVEPAGEHVVRGCVPEVHEGGQEPVGEDQPVLRPGAHSPLPQSRREPGLVAFMSQRAHFSAEFSDHVG